MTESQKQLIREKWRDATEMANPFTYYVKMSGSRELNADAVADFWLNELDLAIKQTEERIVEAIREYAEPYEEARWLNNVDAEKIITLIRNK